MKKIKAKSISRLQLVSQLSVLGALALTGNAQADDAFAANSKYMTGDWGGLRSELESKGYTISAEYVGEVGSNVKGGYNNDKTARYADQFAFGLDMDLQKILGWHDAEFKLAVTERSGRNISNDRIGDPRVGTISSSQEVWGRGQTWRLTQMWYKQKFFDGALDIKLGRFGEGEDFNSFPCDFQNLTLCGSQVGNYVNTWYNWPISQWAARVKYNITPELYAQVGIYMQDADNLDKHNGFTLATSGSQGNVVPVELVWSPMVNKLPGEYRIGYYRSTPNANDLYEAQNGQPQAVVGGNFKEHDDKHGWWVVAQQQLTSVGGDTSRGLSIFGNLTVHDKATNFVDNYQQIGLVFKGPFDARPKDDIGVGVARIHVNDDATDNARLRNQLSGISDYDNPGFVPVQKTEYNSEIYYGVHVTDWLTVRPNLQFVKHPGGVDQVDDAIVAGIKIQSKF
ncbi:porin [Pseudomonas sp. JUb42]|jgi:porin|uniref:carbohydrate porin n=1 Tax=Pseudomonas sp. JUb42 TaxID=2940611 RepID=UPI002169CE87|nr:carbohydrate porin [Pseudomonas sp. JUb42]MCS3470700.1 porin [Pseudomonas sp. JUb42]